MDKEPIKVGESMASLGNTPSALAAHDAYVTSTPSLTLDVLPQVSVGHGDEQHEVTVVLLDASGTRRTESAWYVDFPVPAPEHLVTAVLEPPALEDLETPEQRDERRQTIRHALGFGGTETTESRESLRALLREQHLSLYTAGALGLLGVVDTFQTYAFTVLTPEISHALGLSIGAIAFARVLQFLATVVGPLPMAALSQGRGRRAMLCLVTGGAWSLITVYTGFAESLVALIVVLIFDGLSTGSVAALHPPLVVDSYPARARVRMLSTYQGIVSSGTVASPLVVALLAGPANLTWRGVFLLMGGISLLATLGAAGLRDPAKPTNSAAEASEDASPQLGFFEIVRRLLLIPTVQRVAAGFLVLGILLIPFQTFLSEFLSERWGLDSAGRGFFFAGTGAVSVIGVTIFGRYAEPLFHDSPRRVFDICGLALAGGVVSISVGALVPFFPLVFVFFALGTGAIVVLTPGLNAALLSVVDPRQRPHVSALIGLFTAVGSILGVVFLSSVGNRFGTGGSIVALLIPGVIGAFVIRSARTLVEADLDRMVGEILESQDIASITSRGGKLPMLSARGVNFSYGQLQVLFDVDFTVDDGEMVALLGTNGAGKSTLLKVISGINLPQAGTVRLRGHDITYLDAERRVGLGITQVPGGRAVFGACDVMENLRAFGVASKAPRRQVEESIERCLEVFPRLRERRTSLASTMSGGEQQMLGLSKALILKPQLLLIDELSLGLAPIIVGQLLDLVREINNEGTAVVLVEQSVNIALSLVHHAYFMEKGQMRFDGPAQDLLGRDDLLRAVFLEGVTKAGAA